MPVAADPVLLGAALAVAVGLYAASLLLRDLLRAVIAFAVGSASLAAAFGLLFAPFAAVLELTVGAGLVAVLFLAAITLTGEGGDQVA